MRGRREAASFFAWRVLPDAERISQAIIRAADQLGGAKTRMQLVAIGDATASRLVGEGGVVERLLPPSEVARVAGVCARTLWDWRRRNVGPPFVTIGRWTYRYPEAAFRAWLAERTTNSRAR